MSRWLLVVGIVAVVLVLLALAVRSGGALLVAGGGRSAKRTDPELWERIVKKVKEGSDYGLAGKWNARKAQHAVRLYKEAGGGYKGPKRRDNSLARWTREDWGYVKEGDPTSRYLPKKVREELTPAQKAATNRAKREEGHGANVEWLEAEKKAMKKHYPYNVGGGRARATPRWAAIRSLAEFRRHACRFARGDRDVVAPPHSHGPLAAAPPPGLAELCERTDAVPLAWHEASRGPTRLGDVVTTLAHVQLLVPRGAACALEALARARGLALVAESRRHVPAAAQRLVHNGVLQLDAWESSRPQPPAPEDGVRLDAPPTVADVLGWASPQLARELCGYEVALLADPAHGPLAALLAAVRDVLAAPRGAATGGGSRRAGKTVHVSDKMQKGYSYRLTAEPGKSLSFTYPDDPELVGALAGVRLPFKPQVTPAAMLKRGVFEGKYLNDCRGEFPAAWFADAEKAGKLRPEGADPAVNEFGIKSRLSLQEWRKRNWIPITKHPSLSKDDRAYIKALGKRDGKNYVGYDPDPRGWFQWYCRYWAGRRDEVVDPLQIKRWRAFTRHVAQVKKDPKNPKKRADKKEHRARQRQALLQWAYNPYV